MNNSRSGPDQDPCCHGSFSSGSGLYRNVHRGSRPVSLCKNFGSLGPTLNTILGERGSEPKEETVYSCRGEPPSTPGGFNTREVGPPRERLRFFLGNNNFTPLSFHGSHGRRRTGEWSHRRTPPSTKKLLTSRHGPKRPGETPDLYGHPCPFDHSTTPQSYPQKHQQRKTKCHTSGALSTSGAVLSTSHTHLAGVPTTGPRLEVSLGCRSTHHHRSQSDRPGRWGREGLGRP